MYLYILLIAKAFGMYIQSKLKEKLGFYARFPNAFGLSGKEVAERMLAEHGLTDIRVMSLPDRLRDHYNPQDKTLNLSPEVYGGRSISAAAVAAHECGHILQDVNDYPWLPIRSALAPIVSSVSKGIVIGAHHLSGYCHFFRSFYGGDGCLDCGHGPMRTFSFHPHHPSDGIRCL